MVGCEVCGEAGTAPCRYCDRPVCQTHRRPSRHVCTGPRTTPAIPDRGADADRGRDPIRMGATLVVATLALAAAVLLSTSLSPVAGTGPADGPNETRVEQLVHRFANEERRERRLEPLARDPALARMAGDHSARMARTGTVGHGEAPLADRYARYGLACNGGENVYAVATVGAPYDERSLARRAVDAWLDSPGHRQNLLAERFDAHGVGVATASAAGRTTVYVTQDLC